MASTRRAPQPLHIYQDSVDTTIFNSLVPFDTHNASHVHHNHQSGFVLAPSTSFGNAASPRKSYQHSSSPISHLAKSQSLHGVRIPQPVPSSYTDSPSKKSPYYTHAHYHAGLPQVQPLFSNYPTSTPTHAMNKENYYPYDTPNSNWAPRYGYKAPGKRSPDEAAIPLKDRSNKKARTEESLDFALPHPQEMPTIDDDGSKPSFSYATLIGMAILRAPARRLTLAQIYKWISDNFKHYRATESGWQNSIRHNLSLNKAFIKQERPKDDPGKGNYWAIEPGMEKQFFKDRPMRKLAPPGSEPISLQPLPSSVLRPSAAPSPAIGHFSLGPSVKNKESKAVDSSRFPEDHYSSDGTIPGSDPAMQDDDHADALSMPPPSRALRSSPPPPAHIGSSPPPMSPRSIHTTRRDTTPQEGVSQNGSDSRKRKIAAMQDSGYYSSIESSAVRNPLHSVLVSEGDNVGESRRGGIKRGRAEEEIARIRSSSFDSPTKDKTGQQHGHKKKASVHFEYSSPKRPTSASAVLSNTNSKAEVATPLTPAVVFKKPARPPPSASPNTNLRNHRNRMKALLGDSPGKWTPLQAGSWSPAFTLGSSPLKRESEFWDDGYTTMEKNGAAEVENDDDLTARGSPEKKRPRFDRAARSSDMLAGVTGDSQNALTAHAPLPLASNLFDNFTPLLPTAGNISRSTAFASPNPLRSPVQLESPRKKSFGFPSSGIYHDASNAPDWLDLNLDSYLPTHNDGGLFGLGLQSDDQDEGFDLMAGFAPLGAKAAMDNKAAAAAVQPSPVKKAGQRPGMNRSITSRF